MFTPGPWKILPVEDDKNYIRIRGTQWGAKYKIANIIDNKSHHKEGTKQYLTEHQETMDTARLIKAAPEMFELLNEVLELIDEGDSYHIEKMRPDIRKLLAEILGE